MHQQYEGAVSHGLHEFLSSLKHNADQRKTQKEVSGNTPSRSIPKQISSFFSKRSRPQTTATSQFYVEIPKNINNSDKASVMPILTPSEDRQNNNYKTKGIYS